MKTEAYSQLPRESLNKRFSHQVITAVSFGLTTAVITSLGIIIGMQSATSSRLAVIAGIVVMAFTDGLSDAVSLHTVEEAEVEREKGKHTSMEIWLTTILTFFSIAGFTLTFTLPILILSSGDALWVSIAWGMLLLILLNSYIAKIRKENPIRLISEHISLAVLVIIVSHLVGSLVATML